MTRRVVVPVFLATLVTAAIVAASFGLIAALPQPTSDDRVAVRLLRYLEETPGRGSRISMNGHRLTALCRPLAPRRKLITLSDGTQFVLTGSHIRVWKPQGFGSSVKRPDTGLARAAIADLAGSNALYAIELARPLAHGDRMVDDVARTGRRTYTVILARRPYVALVVDAESLRPLRAHFRAAQIRGTAALLAPGRKHGKRTC